MNTKWTWRMLRGAATLTLAMAILPPAAWAVFHLWEISEVYSNDDGSVQFVELRALAAGQQFLANHTLRSTNSAGASTFLFPTHLPGDTANRTCLIGTASLASVPGGVTPDYIIPPNFIRRPTSGGGAAVIFDPLPSVVVTANLPSDGQGALLRVGTSVVPVATNSPRNFAGESNAIVPVRFTGVAREGDHLVLQFPTASGANATPGPNYIVEGNTVPVPGNWSFVTKVSGNGATHAVALPILADTNQIFRLRVP